MPPELRAAFLEATAATEITDVLCKKHVGAGATVDPAVEAATTVDELRRTWDTLNEFRRVELMARAVHFAADVAAPTALRRGQRLFSWAFFTNRDLVVFREPLPLTSPVAEALRGRGALAVWADDGPGADSLAFRLAANLAAEVLLLVPPARGRAREPDDGPVLFVINRLVRRAPMTGKVVDGVGDGAPPPGTSGGGAKAALGPADRKEQLLARRGVQVAEWASRRAAGRSSVRIVLVNNADSCATRIAFQSPAWRHELAGRIGPTALRTVSLELPDSVSRAELTVTAAQLPCPSAGAEPGQVDGRNRLVYWATGHAPTFESPASLDGDDAGPGEGPASEGAAGVGPVLSAEVDPALLDELHGGLQAGAVSCEVGRVPWVCRLSVRSTGGTPPASLALRLLVTFQGERHGATRETVVFDLRGLPLGVRRELTSSLVPTVRRKAVAIAVEAASGPATARR